MNEDVCGRERSVGMFTETLVGCRAGDLQINIEAKKPFKSSFTLLHLLKTFGYFNIWALTYLPVFVSIPFRNLFSKTLIKEMSSLCLICI